MIPPEKDVFEPGKYDVSIDGNEVRPGDKITYSIVYYNTTANGNSVVISDTIPDLTKYVETVSTKVNGEEKNITPDEGEKLVWTFTEVPVNAKVEVFFTVQVSTDVAGDVLENTAKVKYAENEDEVETNPVSNPTPYKLVIKKALKNFVDHGNNVKATFAFRINDGADFSTVVGMDFEGMDQNERSILIPSTVDMSKVSVEEIVSGNYDPDKTGKVVVSRQEDGSYTVSFENTFNDTDYTSGVVNHYKRGDDGTYSKNGNSSSGTETSPGDETGN